LHELKQLTTDHRIWIVKAKR